MPSGQLVGVKETSGVSDEGTVVGEIEVIKFSDDVVGSTALLVVVASNFKVVEASGKASVELQSPNPASQYPYPG